MPQKASRQGLNMKTYVEVSKLEGELPIPTIWRKTFYDMVEYFKEGDFKLDNYIEDIEEISDDDAEYNKISVFEYGEDLDSLSDKTWNTSLCRWMGDHWDVLIDLNTVNGDSDLVLFITARECNGKFKFKVESIHVP
jgi:hypothetical protein